MRRTRREAAKFLTEQGYPTAFGTLQKLASTGGGPPYQIYGGGKAHTGGGKAIYTDDTLIPWAQARLSSPRSSTSETDEAV